MSRLSDQVLAAAKAVPVALRAFNDKVFLHHVHARMPLVGMLDLPSFKTAIANDADCRGLMSRLDMVQLFPREEVEASNTHYVLGGRVAATWNFVRLPDVPNPW